VTLPAWVRDRVDHFYAIRMKQDWGGRHILRGRTPGPDAILVNSNDYLGLAADPRITTAMSEALTSGTGQVTLASGALLHGDHPQLRLEAELARHMHAPAGVLCQSGWDANAGLLQAIAGERTPVYVDILAHMSLWSGARAAGAPVHPFRHNDLARLRASIGRSGQGVIAVDSLYSTNGSLAPLGELCDLAEDTGCVLVVDESHSLGTHGCLGEGMTVSAGLAGRVHFRIASLSKAFAGRAGFIACCDEDFVDYFKMEAWPAVFSSTLLPHDVAGLAAALAVIRADCWRRDRLCRVSAFLRDGIAALGFDLDGSASQIVALPAGPEDRVIELRDALESRGVFGSVFCSPATARNRSLVRFSLHAGLTDLHVERILQVCREVRDTCGVGLPRPRKGS
jgi:CAI-1 autoinducer synthase